MARPICRFCSIVDRSKVWLLSNEAVGKANSEEVAYVGTTQKWTGQQASYSPRWLPGCLLPRSDPWPATSTSTRIRRFLPVDLARQLLPGTFEHAVNHLLDHAIDLSPFDARFRNDETGAPAYPAGDAAQGGAGRLFPRDRSSRGIEAACRDHVTFIALCGDTAPHFTTIAQFVSTLGADIARVFGAVVAVCDAQGLDRPRDVRIDGVKLPSQAAKQRSGTRADFERQATKLEATAARWWSGTGGGATPGRTHPRGEDRAADRAA